MMALCMPPADVMELAPCSTLLQTTSQRTTRPPPPVPVTLNLKTTTGQTGETVTTHSHSSPVPNSKSTKGQTPWSQVMRAIVNSGTVPTGSMRRTCTQTRWELAIETTSMFKNHSTRMSLRLQMAAWRERNSSLTVETTDKPSSAPCQESWSICSEKHMHGNFSCEDFELERLQLDHEVLKVRCLSRTKEYKKGKVEAKQTHSPETYLDCN